MHRNYASISEGMSKRNVVDALGEPRAKDNQFNLEGMSSFEGFFDAAEDSSAVEYHQWANGMNWFYCIGFDARGNVVLMGEGHS